ncbi:MAG: hypothetical protein AAGH79_06560 [Bacteroidota bacterium]
MVHPISWWLIGFSLCVTIGDLQAQGDRFWHVEALGTGGLGSFSYEQQFMGYAKGQLSWRVGLSAFPIDQNTGTVLVFPLILQGQHGQKWLRLEYGVGQTPSITTRGAFFMRASGLLGLRLERESSPWIVRASYTPLISYLIDFQFEHWGGLSVGYRLQKKTKRYVDLSRS